MHAVGSHRKIYRHQQACKKSLFLSFMNQKIQKIEMLDRSRLEKIKSRQARHGDTVVILEGSHPSCRISTFDKQLSGKMHVIWHSDNLDRVKMGISC